MITAQQARERASENNSADVSEFDSAIESAIEKGDFSLQIPVLNEKQVDSFKKLGYGVERSLYKPAFYTVSW